MLCRRPLKRKLLVTQGENQRESKEIAIYDNPEKLKLLLNKLTWKILMMLSEKEMYPMEIARKLDVHEQKVYYHIRKLVKANAIGVTKEEDRKGAIAKYYAANFPAFGVELPFGAQKRSGGTLSFMNTELQRFLHPVLNAGFFDGKIVVGSPDPHGPFKTSARDGHYASYLAFFFGQFAELPDEFAIKLDVDVKAEKEEQNNLVLVGGPGTNLLTQEVNERLPIRFSMTPSETGFLFGGLVSKKTTNVYTADTTGLVAKIVNPWNRKRTVIVLAGSKAVGTKACVIALAKFWREILQSYHGEDDWATVIQGFDLDGDGKVDSIEVLE
jgi:DNA-binding transcriptional ArsR family regulator